MAYRPPGVYPEKIINPGLIALYQGARIPVVVGPGAYLVTVTVPIVHDPPPYDDRDTLPEAAVEIVRVGDFSDQIKYLEDVDFDFTGSYAIPSDVIDWSGHSLKEPLQGATYWVTYKKKVSADQYKFHIYTDENELVSVHGEESTYNLVSVGGVLVLRNGSPAVGILQLDLEDARDIDHPADFELYNAYEAALPELEKLDTEQCRYIVPMTTLGDDATDTYNVYSLYLDHVDTMSLTSQRRWRMLIVGGAAFPEATPNSTVRDHFKDLATSYNSNNSARRIIVCAPGEVYRVIKDPVTGMSTRTLFDGSILAAAAAGRICSNDNPAIPITWKNIAAISISRVFSNADMNIMANKGVCFFMYKGADLICRHGLTCDLLSADTQEISVVEIEDWVKVQSIFSLEKRYIGSLIVDGLTESMSATLAAYLEGLVLKQVLAEYDSGSISISQDATDPRIFNIFFRVKPAYPLNWIDLKFMFYAGAVS